MDDGHDEILLLPSGQLSLASFRDQTLCIKNLYSVPILSAFVYVAVVCDT